MREEILFYRNQLGSSVPDIAASLGITVEQVNMVLGIDSSNPEPASGSVSDPMTAIQSLRNAGYAVITFSAAELNGVNATKVEDKLSIIGSDVIQYFVDHPEA